MTETGAEPKFPFPISPETVLAQNPDLAHRVGCIVEAWGYIERGLRVIFANSRGCTDREAIKILASEFGTGNRVDQVSAAVELLPGQQYKDDLLKLICEIKQLTKARNRIVHGEYVGRRDVGYAVAVKAFDSSAIPEYLDSHALDLQVFMQRLQPFVQHQPDGSARFPVQWSGRVAFDDLKPIPVEKIRGKPKRKKSGRGSMPK